MYRYTKLRLRLKTESIDSQLEIEEFSSDEQRPEPPPRPGWLVRAFRLAIVCALSHSFRLMIETIVADPGLLPRLGLGG